MLQAVFCKGGMFPVFPLKGLTPTVSDGMSTWKIMLLYVSHYTLPVLCLSYGSFAGIARTHLTMIENGDKQPNFETIWKIAVALNMKPSELVSQIEQLIIEKK